MKKLKVLISAYACEPNKGSEPGVGWHWSLQIARFHETWVITRTNNKECIEKYLLANPVNNIHFIYTDLPKWLRFWKRGEKGLYLYYALWQALAFLKALNLHRKRRLDIVHSLTFGNIWSPAFVSIIPVPFVWGPIGGGEQVPKDFRREWSLKGRIQELIRDFILFSLRLNFFFSYNCLKASKIIVKTKQSASRIPRKHKKKVTPMLETAVHPKHVHLGKKHCRKDVAKIRILSIGRLIPSKGIDLAIKAASSLNERLNDFEYIIIGDGPERKKLEYLVHLYNLSNKVKLLGHMPREKVLEYLCSCDVFLFPSLREGGAWALFEAMYFSLPIICLDIAATSEIIDNESGIKIKPVSPDQAIKQLAAALLKLAIDPSLRKKIGQAGRERVKQHYTWETKGNMVQRIYESALGG